MGRRWQETLDAAQAAEEAGFDGVFVPEHHMMPDGYRLRYLGRLKDMLKVGGENVAALEIASHLQAHPAVSVAQVVGVADEKYGEVPAAFIELQPGMTLSEEEVVAHCRAGLASFKVPRHLRFVTQWPMSSTKVQTFRLREQLEAELARRRGGQRPS